MIYLLILITFDFAVFKIIMIYLFILMIKWFHIHADAEIATMTNSIRLNPNCTSTSLDNLLDHAKA